MCHLTQLGLCFFNVRQNLWTQWGLGAPLALIFGMTRRMEEMENYLKSGPFKRRVFCSGLEAAYLEVHRREQPGVNAEKGADPKSALKG